MDWFSANSWCIAKGRSGLIQLSTLNIALPDENLRYCDFPGSDYYEDETGYNNGSFTNEKAACKTTDGITMTPDNAYANYLSSLKGQIGSNYYWTRGVLSDSCFALLLHLRDGYVTDNYRRHYYPALCE